MRPAARRARGSRAGMGGRSPLHRPRRSPRRRRDRRGRDPHADTSPQGSRDRGGPGGQAHLVPEADGQHRGRLPGDAGRDRGRGRGVPHLRVLLPLPTARRGKATHRGGCDRDANDAAHAHRGGRGGVDVPERARPVGVRMALRRPQPRRPSLRRHGPQVRHRPLALPRADPSRPGRRPARALVLRDADRRHLRVRPATTCSG